MSSRRIGPIFALHAFWMMIVLALGAWWSRFLIHQATRIAELEKATGVPLDVAEGHLHKTYQMMFWESGTFYALLVATTGLLLWLYLRDARRSKSLHAFFASVTHELRTPLTSIRLQAERLAEKNGETEAVRRLLEDATRLESQVQRMLELARVEGGGGTLTQPLRLKPAVERTFQAWRDDHGERLEFRTDPKLAEGLSVQADPSALNVIFGNLLDNSLRHSRREKVHVALDARSERGWVVLDYRDDGDGYNGDPKRLGELFYKHAQSPGAGVGLYLISTLMRKMGGRADFGGDSGFRARLWFREVGREVDNDV